MPSISSGDSQEPTEELVLTAEPLSWTEQYMLDMHEKAIQAHFDTYVEAGHGLTVILKERLYRKQYSTFEEYCQKRWGYTRQNVHDIMAAAKAAEDVKSICQPTRAEARELAKIEPSQRVEVMQAAIDSSGGKLTAAAVKEAVRAKKVSAPKVKHVDVEVIAPPAKEKAEPPPGRRYTPDEEASIRLAATAFFGADVATQSVEEDDAVRVFLAWWRGAIDWDRNTYLENLKFQTKNVRGRKH